MRQKLTVLYIDSDVSVGRFWFWFFWIFNGTVAVDGVTYLTVINGGLNFIILFISSSSSKHELYNKRSYSSLSSPTFKQAIQKFHFILIPLISLQLLIQRIVTLKISQQIRYSLLANIRKQLQPKPKYILNC